MRALGRLVALVALSASLLGTGCVNYVTSECPQCRVMNGRLRDGQRRGLPRLPKTTRHLFVLVPGALGYSWEWNPAVRSLEAARAQGVEFVVFWWEPFGTVRGAARELSKWTNDLLGANDLPELEQVDIVAHSMAGVIAAYAAPSLIPPARGRMRISTIGTAFAGMIGPEFGYPDSAGSIALFSVFSPWVRYPRPARGLQFVEYRTAWPEDPVMEPRFGHDPAPLEVGPRPRTRVQLPHMDHNKCVALVVDELLRGEALPQP